MFSANGLVLGFLLALCVFSACVTHVLMITSHASCVSMVYELARPEGSVIMLSGVSISGGFSGVTDRHSNVHLPVSSAIIL